MCKKGKEEKERTERQRQKRKEEKNRNEGKGEKASKLDAALSGKFFTVFVDKGCRILNQELSQNHRI